jgi:hypothetical protein
MTIFGRNPYHESKSCLDAYFANPMHDNNKKIVEISVKNLKAIYFFDRELIILTKPWAIIIT